MNLAAETTLQAPGYQLENRIGGGSSGEVWRAERDGQTVAIKFLKDTLLSSPQRETHLRRFATEITALQRLNDMPHIPRIVDYALDTGRPYVVMEFVEGEGFASLLASGTMMRIPLRQRFDLLAGVARALDAAHEARILHRDIKPSNMRGTDHPYLLDFSVALDLNQPDDDLKAHVGTRLYRPPQPCDPAGLFRDRYGFAVVCYEILFGRHPFFLREEIRQHESDLEEVARLRLWSRTWYRPSTLEAAILPINLSGAHLVELDHIFQSAFETDHYGSAVALVTALRQQVDVPENADYIDLIPSNLPHDLIGHGDYTEHEMQIQAAHTDLDQARPVNWLWIALPVAVLTIIAIALLQSGITG
jgi:serine/threonine protein kinase